MKDINKLIWLDLEMTGLDVCRCHIIEIAIIITDKNLNILSEFPSVAIKQKKSILETMNTWCLKQHTKSGLLERVLDSNISVVKAEKMVIDFIKAQGIEKNSSPLCGNSVWQDRRFLSKYMPTLEDYLHYRLFDVSTFKIAASMWNPNVLNKFNKTSVHLALEDIKDSIQEMKTYRKYFLQSL